MVSDHPTENDTTDLAMPSEPVAAVLGAASEDASVPLPSPVSVEVEGGQGVTEPAATAPAAESASVAAEVQAAELTGRPMDEGRGAAADAGETLQDESRAVAETGEAPQEQEAGEAIQETSEMSQETGETQQETGETQQDVGETQQDVGEVIEEAGETAAAEELKKDWYILKVQVNREDSIRDALLRRVKIEGLEPYFGDIIVPTEEVAEFNKSGKRRVVRRKLYPGYILVHMAINDDTWFVVRETPGVGDFTGSAGKPTPMEARDVDRILRLGAAHEERGGPIKTAIPFKSGDRVRVKDGHFQNFEGEVDAIDEANGRITVMINIFNRSTPVELEHWQVESV